MRPIVRTASLTAQAARGRGKRRPPAFAVWTVT
jgi:hypothetical protein